MMLHSSSLYSSDGPKHFISPEWERSAVRAFFVHSSIFEKIQLMPNISIRNVWDYELQLGKLGYSMKLVFVNADAVGSFQSMMSLCNCEVTFPWEDHFTLYVAIKWFPLLDRFIETQPIRFDVESVEDRPAIDEGTGMIRIVHFGVQSSLTKIQLAKKFRDFLRIYTPDQYTMSLYCTIAFPWLQPWALTHFDIPLVINSSKLAVTRIILENTKHLSNNIFDLVTLRMAFCDCRDLQPTASIQSELDRAIVRSLKDPKYNQNNGFDLDKYMYDHNVATNDRFYGFVLPYFTYIFQHYIGRLASDNRVMGHHDLIYKLNEIDSSAVLRTIKIKSNLEFKIDGEHFDRADFKLFIDLAECHNVAEITLDTNYPLIDSDVLGRKYPIELNLILYLLGGNTHNFIEDFIMCLKAFLSTNKVVADVTMYIDCDLNSYRIFDDLPIVCLIFCDTNISAKMLNDFKNCTNIRTPVSFKNCRFEYDRENWQLLSKLKAIRVVDIQEEDNTWESVFDFAAHVLTTSGLKEFGFDREIKIVRASKPILNFRDFKFLMVGGGNKLELVNATTNEILDLYCLKFQLESDDACDYDFYQ